MIFILRYKYIINSMQPQADSITPKVNFSKKSKTKRIIYATIWLLARELKKYKFLSKKN